MLAIADAAGGEWPTRARRAAIALSSEEDELSVGMRLLADIRDAFGDADHLPTSELLDRLHELEDAPWGEWYGKPLTARGLSRLLEPYRVRPLRQRVGGTNLRGYFRSEFTDAWARYVPAQESGTSGTSGSDGVAVPDVPDVPVSQTQTELPLDDGYGPSATEVEA